MLIIDGGKKHGGGSILRLATALSVLTQKPIRIINVRAGRPQPGLKTQHLVGLNALADLCDATLKGATLGSMEVEFIPKVIKKQNVEIEIPTAGSIALVLQPLILASVYTKHKIKIKIRGGATYGKWAPPIDFLKNITLRILEKMNYKVEVDIKKYGFYPKGGAFIEVVINPTNSLAPLILKEQGKIKIIKGISVASSHLMKAKVAERQKEACEKILSKRFNCPIEIDTLYVDTESVGSSLTVWIETENTVLGNDEIGERGVRAEVIGEKVATRLCEEFETGATLDSFTTDQIIPFLALISGNLIKIPKITDHVESSLWLTEKFFEKKFKLKKNKLITIEG